MKKALVILAAAAAFVIFLAIVNRERDFSDDQLREIVGDSLTLLRLAQADPVDFSTFERTYEKSPRDLVRWVDTTLDIEMDDKITTSLKAAKTGTYTGINAQIAALTVTRVFREYFNIQSKRKEDDDHLMRMRWCVEGMLPAFEAGVKEGVIGYDTLAPLRRFRESPDGSNDLDAVQLAIRNGIAAAWIAEVNHMEVSRQSDFPASLIHTVRALQFMHMLYEDYSPAHREDAVYIYGELQKDPREIDLPELRARMRNVIEPIAPGIPVVAFSSQKKEGEKVSGDADSAP